MARIRSEKLGNKQSKHGNMWATANGILDFTVSPSWCFRFDEKTWVLYPYKNNSSSKLPSECGSKIIEFHRLIISARRKYNFEINQVANVDKVQVHCLKSRRY